MKILTFETYGMMCSMCESHICSEIRRRYPDFSVHASRRKKTVEIKADDFSSEDEKEIRSLITGLGYDVKDSQVTTGKEKRHLLFR